MRVLKGKILVVTPRKQESNTSLILEEDDVRTGSVHLTGSDQLVEEEKVMFGDDFEEIQMDGEHRAFLMNEDNIKLILTEKI